MAIPGMSHARMVPPAHPDLDVIVPSDDQAGHWATVHAARFKTVPELRLMPSSREALRVAVDWARAQDVPLTLRSGGHCLMGFSSGPGVVLDLRGMNAIRVEGGRVTVGPGAAMGDIYAALAAKGRTLPGGVYSSVAAAGLMSGGGFGYQSQRRGLMADWLVGARMIDADGVSHALNEGENTGAFWAARGIGGGQLGILEEMTFDTLPLPRAQAVKHTVRLDHRAALEALYLWQVWSGGEGARTHFQLIPDVPGQMLVTLSGLDEGGDESFASDAGEVLRQPAGLPEAAAMAGSMSDVAAYLYGAPGVVGGNTFLTRSYMFPDWLSNEALAAVFEVARTAPPNAIQLNFEPLDPPAADGAFPHRSARMILHAQSIANTPERLAIAQSQQSALAAVVAPYTQPGVYVNYPERDLSDYADAYWGANLPRLSRVADAWETKRNGLRWITHPQPVPTV